MSVNPWLSINRDTKPYVAEVDREPLAEYTLKKKSLKDEFRLNTSVVPEPWCGPVMESSVLVLSGNPHWDERDESLPSQAHKEMWENLSGLHPLFWLSPELAETSGGKWYCERLLKEVLKECPAEKVAHRLSLIDFVGYRSHRWDHQLRVPSQQFTIELVEQAIKSEKVIVLSRGRRLWEELIPELSGYGRLFHNKSPQNVRLSANNTSQQGFDAILSALM